MDTTIPSGWECSVFATDDVLNRDKMIGYHDSYAEAMSKYGLKRGVRGSDARHTTTAQYYRNIKRETERLQNCMKLLQSDIEEAQRLLFFRVNGHAPFFVLFRWSVTHLRSC